MLANRSRASARPQRCSPLPRERGNFGGIRSVLRSRQNSRFHTLFSTVEHDMKGMKVSKVRDQVFQKEALWTA
jgi:hypothetical protein